MAAERRKRGPRGDISTETLLVAADRILDAGGPPTLSLRTVAREAGVTPTVLYTYFDDMFDLRNQLGDAFLGRIDLGLLQQSPAAKGLRALLDQVTDLFEHNLGHAALLSSQRIMGPHALALNEALLDFFIDEVGHSAGEAASITGFLTEWVHGRVQLAPSNPATGGFLRALAHQDLESYPRTTEMLNHSTDGNWALDVAVRAFTTPRKVT